MAFLVLGQQFKPVQADLLFSSSRKKSSGQLHLCQNPFNEVHKHHL